MVITFMVMAFVLARVPFGAAPAASSFSSSLNSFSILMLARSCSLAGAFSSIKIFSHSPISAKTCSLVRGPRMSLEYLMRPGQGQELQVLVWRLEGAGGLAVQPVVRVVLLVAQGVAPVVLLLVARVEVWQRALTA